jgi:hypothetical protein
MLTIVVTVTQIEIDVPYTLFESWRYQKVIKLTLNTV